MGTFYAFLHKKYSFLDENEQKKSIKTTHKSVKTIYFQSTHFWVKSILSKTAQK